MMEAHRRYQPSYDARLRRRLPLVAEWVTSPGEKPPPETSASAPGTTWHTRFAPESTSVYRTSLKQRLGQCGSAAAIASETRRSRVFRGIGSVFLDESGAGMAGRPRF